MADRIIIDALQGLTFDALRKANLARLPQFKNAKGLPAHSKPDGSDWSPAQWLQAVVGEIKFDETYFDGTYVRCTGCHERLARVDIIDTHDCPEADHGR